MMKKLIIWSAFFMGAFSIFSLIRIGSPQMPSNPSSNDVQTLSSEVRDGGPDSGFILFGIDLNSILK